MKDIAEKTGVHSSTVSRIINNDPKLIISKQAIEKVLTAVKEMNYAPNAYARILHKNSFHGNESVRTWNIGVIASEEMYPGFFGPFYSKVYRGIQRRRNPC